MRMSVSRSRPCNFGASSLASLTRVCNAIRSALVGGGILPLRDSIIPEVWPQPVNLAKLAERIELLHDLVELLFALTHNARRSFFKWLLGWNALEPALLG